MFHRVAARSGQIVRDKGVPAGFERGKLAEHSNHFTDNPFNVCRVAIEFLVSAVVVQCNTKSRSMPRITWVNDRKRALRETTQFARAVEQVLEIRRRKTQRILSRVELARYSPPTRPLAPYSFSTRSPLWATG